MSDEFVAVLSHELRTPLASIQAHVEMLIDGEARHPGAQHEFHEIILNEANRLGRLIDNILSISRLESGLARAELRAVGIVEVLTDAMAAIVPEARQKHISLTADFPSTDYQTLADREMLHEAVVNLLNNAVQYTPSGGAISMQVCPGSAAGKVLCRINDTGVGISPKDIPFIFDKFHRCAAGPGNHANGGLGLAVVKHIIEIVHKGRVFVESEVGKGSCFSFELDLCNQAGA